MRGSVAALLSREGSPNPDSIRHMLAAAAHRGRDLTVEVVGSAALGVSNDPEEPNATLARDREFVAAFVGALDNPEEIRASIPRGGAPDVGSSPATLLLAGYRAHGTEIVSRLRGSFAGVISDGVEVLCFRDHFGSRALFFHEGPSGFFAGSEVKQVLAGSPLDPEPDLDHLHRSIYGTVGASTPFRGVERVGEQVVLRAGPTPGPTKERFWDPDALVETATLTLEQAVEGTVAALERAVHRMRSGRDVILLSGGLDSPALAAFGEAREGLPSMRALTAVYPSAPSVDESEWTTLAAEHVGMRLDGYEAAAGALEDVDSWVALVDAPVVALSMPESAEAYREARALGGRTIMTGEIAEMVFETRTHLLAHLLWRGRFGAAARVLRQHRLAGRGRRGLSRDLMRAILPERWLPESLRPPLHPRLPGLPAWVDPQTLLAYSDLAEFAPKHPRHRWRLAQTSPFQGPSTGFEADEICAAACGVEVRRPFADVDLWEFVLSLPAEVKFPDRETKPLLRRAMRGILPDALIDRKDKTYFDEFHLEDADYRTLRRLLVGSPHRVDGIDYERLGDHIERRDMTMYELTWAQNVARIHAFLDRW